MDSKIIQQCFGNRLRAIRKHRNLIQEEIAEKVSFHFIYIGQEELELRNVTLQTIAKLHTADEEYYLTAQYLVQIASRAKELFAGHPSPVAFV